jgi:DNA-binding MarR family transcriptional regulator
LSISARTRQDEQVSERFGFELPLLLLGAFRAIIDELHAELARLGHPGARPIHGFALQALGPDGVTIGELGRRLGVSKQAAAKTAKHLEEIGYAARAPHPDDGRSAVLTRTELGTEMLGLSALIFERQRERWAELLGGERLGTLEDDLAALAGQPPGMSMNELPGWFQ